MLYNTFIIINNNWKRAMESSDKKQNNVVVDEQGAQNLQQVKDTEKTVDTIETQVKEDQKIKEDDKIEVGISDKAKGKEKDKFETISIVKQRKVIETNLAKIMGTQAVVMGVNALVGLSNPIGLMICVAIAFKKLTASTKNIEFKQDTSKIKNTNDKKSEAKKIVIDILDDDNKIEETIGKSNPVVLNINKDNSEEINLEINKKTLDEIGKLFSKEEQEKCAETGKFEISEEQAKKLNNIFNCNTIKAGILDFNDEKSINNFLGNENPKIIEELKSALNPKISKNTQQTPTSARKVVVGKGQGIV